MMVKPIRINHSFGTRLPVIFLPPFTSSKMSLQWLMMIKVLTPVMVMRTMVPYILSTLLTENASISLEIYGLVNGLSLDTQVSLEFLNVGLKRPQLVLSYLFVYNHSNLNEDRICEENEDCRTWWVIRQLLNNFWAPQKYCQ